MKFGFPFGVTAMISLVLGLGRWLSERQSRRRHVGPPVTAAELESRRRLVAVCLSARNEEADIEATIRSAARMVPVEHVFVVSDGSTDETAARARTAGANVLTNDMPVGKPSALEQLMSHFGLLERFPFILVVDGDTVLCADYVDRALRVMEDERVACVGGYATSRWEPHRLPRWRHFVTAYRTRLYIVLQSLITYGQTARHRRANLYGVVPGFASMYRSSVLQRLQFHIPGLAIEDFGLAFQIRRYNLGLIAHYPVIGGICHDPYNVEDYYQQVRRWNMGFFQTLRHFGLWPSLFCFVVVLFTAEILVTSVFFVVFPVMCGAAAAGHIWAPDFVREVAVVVYLTDYVLTVAATIKTRRPLLLLYGLGFFYFRILDSLIFLRSLPAGLLTESEDVWTSPSRR